MTRFGWTMVTLGLVALGILVTCSPASAGTYYWDGNTSNANGQSDNANTTGQNWLSDGNWDNGAGSSAPLSSWTAGDSAVFGGSASSQTITAGTITVGNMTFGSGGDASGTSGTNYTVSGGTVTLSNTTITTNTNTTIGSVLAGSSGSASLTKAGAGTLTLSGTNTYAGATTINEGMLKLPAGLPTGAVLDLDANQGVTTNSSGQVTSWADLSGSSNNAAGVSGAYPTLSSAVINGRAGVTFNGTSKMNITSLSGALASETILAVVKTSATKDQAILGASVSGGLEFRLNGSNQLNLLKENSAGMGNSTGTITQGTATVVGTTWTSGSQAYYIGSSQSGSSTYSGSLTTSYATLGYWPTYDLLYGSIGEVVVYNRVLGPTEMTAALTYLNRKWLSTTGGNVLPAATAVTIGNSGTLDLNGNSQQVAALADSSPGVGGNVINSATGMTSTLTFSPTGGATNTFSGVIAGGGVGQGMIGVVMNGNGTQILSGTNTYTGATIVSAGTLKLGSANGVPDNTPITVTGGTLDLNTFTKTTTAAVSFQGGTTQNGTIVNNGSVYNCQGGTVQASLQGSAGLTQSGSGTLVLSNSNTYAGPTTISGGTLNLAHNLAVQQSTVTLSTGSGAMTFATGVTQPTLGGLSGNGAATLTSATGEAVRLKVGNNNAVTSYDGVLSGAGGLTKIGNGTLTLTATQNYSGDTVVDGGTLKLQGPNYTSVSVANSSFEQPAKGGIAGSYYENTTPTGWSQTGAGGIAYVSSAYVGVSTMPDGVQAAFTKGAAGVYGALSQSSISFPSNATYTISFYDLGRSGYSNPIAVSIDGGTIGTITPSTTQWTNHSVQTTLAAGFHTLAFTNTTSGPNPSVNFDLVTIRAYKPTFDDVLPPSSSLAITSGAKLDLNGGNQRATSLADSNGSGGTVTNGSLTLASVLTLQSDSVTPAIFSGTIEGGAGKGVISLVKKGTATQTLSGPNSYTGTTTVSTGTLAAGAANALSAYSDITVTGGTLDVSGYAQTIKSLTMTGGYLDLGIGKLLTSNGLSSLVGTINVSGTPSGSLIELIACASGISGDNIISGTIPNGYTLQYNSTHTALNLVSLGPPTFAWVGTSENKTWATGTNWTPSNTTSGPGGTDTVVTFGNSGSQATVDLGMSGKTVGVINFTGQVATTLLNDPLSEEVLSLNNTGGSTITVNHVTGLDPHTDTISVPLELNNDLSVKVADGGDRLVIDRNIGQFGGSYGLTLAADNAGTVVLGGTLNSYSAGTTVSGGTLVIASAGALPAGKSLSIGSGGTLILGGGMAMGTAASAEPVPEPCTLALLAIAGLAGVMIWRRKLKNTGVA